MGNKHSSDKRRSRDGDTEDIELQPMRDTEDAAHTCCLPLPTIHVHSGSRDATSVGTMVPEVLDGVPLDNVQTSDAGGPVEEQKTLEGEELRTRLQNTGSVSCPYGLDKIHLRGALRGKYPHKVMMRHQPIIHGHWSRETLDFLATFQYKCIGKDANETRERSLGADPIACPCCGFCYPHANFCHCDNLFVIFSLISKPVPIECLQKYEFPWLDLFPPITSDTECAMCKPCRRVMPREVYRRQTTLVPFPPGITSEYCLNCSLPKPDTRAASNSPYASVLETYVLRRIEN